MEQINIRMTEQLRDQLDQQADELGFSSRAEYVRYICRQELQRAGGSDANT